MSFRIDCGDSNRVARLKLLYLVPFALIALPVMCVVDSMLLLNREAHAFREAWNHRGPIQ